MPKACPYINSIMTQPRKEGGGNKLYLSVCGEPEIYDNAQPGIILGKA